MSRRMENSQLEGLVFFLDENIDHPYIVYDRSDWGKLVGPG
jgi:hypothetical protein